jgi:fructose-bisphosphate aldolase class 1
MRRAERHARRYPCAVAVQAKKVVFVEPVVEPEVTMEKAVNFSSPWTVELARLAFEAHKASGLSQRAFAEANGFSASRFGTWKNRV